MQEKTNNNPLFTDGQFVICHCNQVTVSELDELMKRGKRSYRELRTYSGAGLSCGDCRDDLLEYILNRKGKN